MSRKRVDGLPPGRTDTLFKWVVRITSVCTLVLVTVQVVRLVSDVRDRRRQIDELMRVQQLQVQSADYAAAWATVEQALRMAESGGQLAKLTGQVGTDVQRVRVAQEDLAMAWSEHLSAPDIDRYKALAAQITPVMLRGVTTTSGVRKADLQAHIGQTAVSVAVWSYAISRDPGPEEPCRAALAADPANPYAHACLGSWIVSSNRPIEEGMREFSTAIAANRARPFVRSLQRVTLKQRGQNADPFLVVVANDMRKNGEPVSPVLRRDVYEVYSSACGGHTNADGMRELLALMPVADLLAIFQTLVIESPEREASWHLMEQACFGTLHEEAGDRDRALAAWRSVREAFGARPDVWLAPRADAAIQRLTRR